MDINLEHLRTLSAVIDNGSFEGAAVALHITASAVSQRIKALELSAGTVIVQRTRPAAITDAGEVFLRLAREIELLAAEALRELDVSARDIRVSLVANADSLDTWLLPALATVPGVIYDIQREDQDHSAELLRSGVVAGAVTSDAEAVQGCSVSPIGSMTYAPVATPAFVEQWLGGGATAVELAEAPVVVFDRKDDLQDAYLRSRGVDPSTPPRHFVPGSGAFVRAVELGLGWGMLPKLQAGEAVRRGELAVFDHAGAVDVALFWQQWGVGSRALASVGAALASALKEDTYS